MNNVRYVYGLSSALLVGGAAISLITGSPLGAQVAQNDDAVMNRVVPVAGAPASFADLTAQLQPAVVNIATRQRVPVTFTPPGFEGAQRWRDAQGDFGSSSPSEAQSTQGDFRLARLLGAETGAAQN